jgi:hypothetical protein
VRKEDENDKFHEAEASRELPNYSEKHPQRTDFVTDLSRVSLLANICDSLVRMYFRGFSNVQQWLSEQIESLGSAPSYVKKETKATPKNILHRTAAEKTKRLKTFQILFIHFLEQTKSTSIMKLSPNMDVLSKTLKSLSELCLFALRLDLRIRVYHYLFDGIKKVTKCVNKGDKVDELFLGGRVN